MHMHMFHPSISTHNGRFIDRQGREVILHGVNLVNKNPRENYLAGSCPEYFAAMRQWGFNCVRLGVIWDGLEPQPGAYDLEYLAAVDMQIAWAAQYGIYVILDMHQDLYSALFSDGAPAWATLTDGLPHEAPGGVWSDAYFTSPAVQAALDNFWANAPAPDGIGLQEHYATAWQMLAKRYAQNETVIAYDLMNEPFPGSAAQASQWMLFTRGAELLTEREPGQVYTAEDLAMQWLDPQGRRQILAKLDDAELFAQIIDVTQPVYAGFERTQLMPFYQRVADAIRAVDSDHILLLETTMGSNMGVYSAIEGLRLDGTLDAAQAYAPHGYDLVVDTPYLAEASPARVELIFQRHGQTAQRLGLPMLVGEWGAFDERVAGTLPAAWAVSRQFELLLCGDTYWHFAPDLDRQPAFQALSRPFPECVTGRLLAYGYNLQSNAFECEWDEQPGAAQASRFYFPAWFAAEQRQPQLEPPGAWQLHTAEQGAWLEVAPLDAGARRRLKI